MQVETPLNSTICTLRDLGNYNKKTFCNLSKARLSAGVVFSSGFFFLPPQLFLLFIVCLGLVFWGVIFVYEPVKNVFFHPQKIQQFTCLWFFLEVFTGLWPSCRNILECLWLLDCCTWEHSGAWALVLPRLREHILGSTVLLVSPITWSLL